MARRRTGRHSRSGRSSAGSAGNSEGIRSANVSLDTYRKKSNREGKSRGPRIDSDGKAQIKCPQCGQAYRVPEDQLDSKLTCGNCKRSFFPRMASTRGLRKQTDLTPFLWGGAGLVAIIVVGVLISSFGGSKPVAEPVQPKASAPNLASNERVAEVQTWVEAAGSGDTFGLEMRSDLAALQKHLEVESATPYAQLVNEQQAELKGEILAAITAGEQGVIFRDFQWSDGILSQEADLTGNSGTVKVTLAPRDTKRYGKNRAYLDIHFNWDGHHPKVTHWKIISQPKVIKRRAPRAKPHEQITKPTAKKISYGGKEITILESEPVALEHLPDTPPAIAKEIDDLIAKMLDLDGEGKWANRARLRFQEIGKAVIPRLLTKFYEIRPSSPDDILRLQRVVHALRDLTGVAFGYNPLERSVMKGLGGSVDDRESALKQWYAWWWRHANDPNWQYAIDKADDESLFETKEQKAARKAREQATSEKTKTDGKNN